jgi:hypothetical protein
LKSTGSKKKDTARRVPTKNLPTVYCLLASLHSFHFFSKLRQYFEQIAYYPVVAHHSYSFSDIDEKKDHKPPWHVVFISNIFNFLSEHLFDHAPGSSYRIYLMVDLLCFAVFSLTALEYIFYAVRVIRGFFRAVHRPHKHFFVGIVINRTITARINRFDFSIEAVFLGSLYVVANNIRFVDRFPFKSNAVTVGVSMEEVEHYILSKKSCCYQQKKYYY